MPQTTWSNLPTRQVVTFFDPANPATTYTPQINPTQLVLKPHNVRKYTPTTNGTSVIMGDREYPPQEISLTWPQMDASDFEGIRPFIYTNPIVMVDNNDQGYLGVLVIDDAEQVAGKAKLVYTVRASFLVLGPYNGQHTTLPQVAAPTIATPTVTQTGGYIPNSTTLYFWLTAFTPFGESIVGASATASTLGTSGWNNTGKIALSWTAPSSAWFRKTRLYWSSTNSSATATLLSEQLAGQSTSFTVYGPYFAYSTINPPTYGSAFSGYFSGGKWTPQ